MEIFAIVILAITFMLGFGIGSSDNEDGKYKKLYEQSVCESKGLQVGKLENITVCLNPETKAVYKIELPTVKKDK
jgi:sporulation protein YlmC with PRC-barrel domain